MSIFRRCQHRFSIYLNSERYVSYDDGPYGTYEYLHACDRGCGKTAWLSRTPTNVKGADQ